jgi:quercetin dioxygenase-like cupin family protein
MKTVTDHELWFLDTRESFPVTHEDGSDGVSVICQWAPEGHSPPLHVHEQEDEIFHLLQGRLSFRVGDELRTLDAGETVLAPKRVPHTFVVESAGGAVCLVITAHGDFERFVRSCARPGGPAAPDPEALAAAAAEHRIAIVGPPLR